jgi:hypothetical protein
MGRFGLVKVTLVPGAVERLFNEPGVLADLERRGHQIATAAGPGHKVELDQTQPRPRVDVMTDTIEAMLSEANNRTLTRAVDAGRG